MVKVWGVTGMIFKADLQTVLRALHRVASEKPDERISEEQGNEYGPRLRQEGVSLWNRVSKVTELREDDPAFDVAWKALVTQARKYLGESEVERRLSRN
jgi:hypothetical protein